MKVEQEEAKFKPIEVTFHVKIETQDELFDLVNFTKDPFKKDALAEKNPDKKKLNRLNSAGRLFLDFAMGVLRDRHATS